VCVCVCGRGSWWSWLVVYFVRTYIEPESIELNVGREQKKRHEKNYPLECSKIESM